MRIFNGFREALAEIKRDLVEMGIPNHSLTYQNKNIAHDPNFNTRELQCYIYQVSDPDSDFRDLPQNKDWADAEFQERIGAPVNPGKAWTLRSEVWTEFLNEKKQFDYTYSERLCRCNQINRIIEEVRTNPDSRQLFCSVWDVLDITKIRGKARIPCTLGYYFQARRGKLYMTYLQRSADFATHFQHDIYLAHLLQRHVAVEAGLPLGYYAHWLGSLHIFEKDCAGVF